LGEDGAWRLRSKNKKAVYHCEEQHNKKIKKVVTEKVVKSKKPKKYAKNCRLFTTESRFL